MKSTIREYRDSDYKACEALVNQAWHFDEYFSPQELAELAKYMYTEGSVKASNYRKVMEIDGGVAGFLFGLNEAGLSPGRNILFGLRVLWRLFRIKGLESRERKKLLNAIRVHEKNRSGVVARGKSEITLFVIDSDHQGRGLGKILFADFSSHCREYGAKSIIVETNKLGASRFYEKMGFRHIGDFDSPLHEYATKGGQACMYEFDCDQ